MLSSLASFLLGSQSSEQAAVAADVRIRTIDACDDDDDWVLIDAATASSGPEALTVLSRTSSASSLPVEDSWFVTPPPCFTSAGPVHVETSPLEDLLIEHPSMSVYQRSPAAVPLPLPVPLVLPLPLPPSSEEDAGAVPPPEDAAIAPRRSQTAPLYSLQQQQALHARSAQKLQQRRVYQSFKGKHLDRHNKTREVNSRNRQLRRSDHMLHHSGANNNRKC